MKSGCYILLLACLFVKQGLAQDMLVVQVAEKMKFLEPDRIRVNGLLGEAINSNRDGRLATLPVWRDGELIKMFSKQVKSTHGKMDWYGEHGGKWLYAASHAAKQSGNKELEALVLETADYLVKQQEENGYLGNYGPTVRITNDTISHRRSWDVWNLSYMTLGLLQTNRHYPKPAYLRAAKGIGELFIRLYGDGRRDITKYGTRKGLSSTVVLDPVVELYKATGDQRYLELAAVVINQLENEEDHRLITAGLNRMDMEHVGDGKIYQIIWNLTGVVKLYEVTGKQEYLTAAKNIWDNITEEHLNITGGPWGGIGKHMECFNRKNFWSPYGMVETCSTMAWIQLNKELLRLTGEARFAQAIERSAYNALLGARFPNGVDWSYHSFTNGSWSVANFNDCCPSSGALALEEIPAMIYSAREQGVAVNLFGPSEASVPTADGQINIVQNGGYPFEENVSLTISPLKKQQNFPVFIRVPDWAPSVEVMLNGKAIDNSTVSSDGYLKIFRSWKKGDVIIINFPFGLRIEQKREFLNGPQNAAQIYNMTWFSISRGPLVFAANGLIEGTDRERSLPVGAGAALRLFIKVESPDGAPGPAYRFEAPGIQPLLFVPYYRAGGMRKGGWRLTWLPTRIDDLK